MSSDFKKQNRRNHEKVALVSFHFCLLPPYSGERNGTGNKRVNAWCKPPVLGKLTTERALADFRCQLSNRRKSSFLYSSSVSTAIPVPCDSSSLCVGLCVSRKFIDWGANVEFPATFYPHASTNFLQLIETIFTTRHNGESALSNVLYKHCEFKKTVRMCAPLSD